MPAAGRISTGHGSEIPGVTIALHGRLTGRHLATHTHTYSSLGGAGLSLPHTLSGGYVETFNHVIRKDC